MGRVRRQGALATPPGVTPNFYYENDLGLGRLGHGFRSRAARSYFSVLTAVVTAPHSPHLR